MYFTGITKQNSKLMLFGKQKLQILELDNYHFNNITLYNLGEKHISEMIKEQTEAEEEKK